MIQELLGKLRSIEPYEYYDEHGNAHQVIQQLMKARFESTAAITKEIDASSGNGAYTTALYDVLGFVKDPAAIWWLDRKTGNQQHTPGIRTWLARWRTPLSGARESELRWLESRESWAEFFRSRIDAEKDSSWRFEMLCTLAGWFHDVSTIEYFSRLERNPITPPNELLVSDVYLVQHRCAYDPEMLSRAIETLQPSANNHQLLLQTALEIRSERYVPFLISNADVGQPAGWVAPQDALEAICMQLNLHERSQWEHWYSAHRGESRQVWLDRAMTDLLQLAEADPHRAREFLERAMYRWNDRSLLPVFCRLADHQELHSDLVGWLNLSYHPYWREDFRPLIDRITRSGLDKLEPWARDRLRELGFVGFEQMTWEQFVETSNMLL